MSRMELLHQPFLDKSNPELTCGRISDGQAALVVAWRTQIQAFAAVQGEISGETEEWLYLVSSP